MIMFLTVLSWNSISSGLSLPLSCRCPNLSCVIWSSISDPRTFFRIFYIWSYKGPFLEVGQETCKTGLVAALLQWTSHTGYRVIHVIAWLSILIFQQC